MIFFLIYIQLNVQKLQTSARTDAAPDARLFSHLVKFSKRGVILILSKCKLFDKNFKKKFWCPKTSSVALRTYQNTFLC